MSARGTRRQCALPNYEHFAKRLAGQRNWRQRWLYDEYVQACERARERPYSWQSFYQGLLAWRRSGLGEDAPEWYPAEYMTTYWARAEHAGAPLVLFVAQLAYSDLTFVCRAEAANVDWWMRCCQRCYLWLGGVPFVTDCSMANVSAKARRTLEAFAHHYRTVLYGAGPKTAKTAEKRAKPLAHKGSSLVLRELKRSLEALGPLDDDRLDAEISRRVDLLNGIAFGRPESRRSMFDERERPQLLGLPDDAADMARWSSRKVADDHHVTVGGVRYSVDWRLAGDEVAVSWTDKVLRCYHMGELVAEHGVLAEPRGRCTVTDDAHRPPTHSWFAKRMEHRFTDYAAEIGPNVEKAMEAVVAACRERGQGFRECKELVDLKDAPSEVTLDEACAAAIAAGTPNVDAVRARMGVA